MRRRRRPYNHELAQMMFANGEGGLRRDFYVYEVESLLLAAGVSSTDTIQIEADSDFWLQKLAYDANDDTAIPTANTRPVPAASIVIADTGSGRQFMNAAIPIASIFGSGGLPFILPHPRFINRNGSITVTFTNFSNEIGAGATYNLRLAFIGYKIYDEMRPQSARG